VVAVRAIPVSTVLMSTVLVKSGRDRESILAVEGALLRSTLESAEGLPNVDMLDAVVVFVVLYVKRKGGHGDGLADQPGDSLLSWSVSAGGRSCGGGGGTRVNTSLVSSERVLFCARVRGTQRSVNANELTMVKRPEMSSVVISGGAAMVAVVVD
jgi:hypothetical protein